MSQLVSLPSRLTEVGLRPETRTGGPELSVVVPTFREAGNVAALVEKLDAALQGCAWEVVFVDDDSPDGTADVVKEIALSDSRVRCLRRVSRRGLAGACIEGILSSSAPYVAVMDADLQHDETVLPRMLSTLKSGDSDLVVGTRYAHGGSADAFSKTRGAASRLATWLSRTLTGVKLSDPMSGFFMIRREAFDPLAASLFPQGFKILLDIVITAKGTLRIAEEPYVFGARLHGESKLDTRVAMDFLGLLLAKLSGGAVTPRFLSFILVGTLGLGVHLAALDAALTSGLSFTPAYVIGALVAMTSNFLFNNALTYRDKRIKGLGMITGLLGFYLVSAVGLLTGVGTASWLYAYQPVWWLAGFAGAVMGAVWNYSMSTLFVWRVK
ncbi:MAG TPA: glycosyltransferase family 2 protein [Micropepsaceae bacterium]|jgi:dolichol-phosphate mannosyltransferase|nr:glycosyltransferase family 2 protein [Micropepsaceae bacterium]